MKVVILCGGLGTRMQEETELKPKPMVEIGGKPLLWHIMSIYAAHGYKDFTIALGYKGEYVKNYFLNYYYLRDNLTVHLNDGKVDVHGVGREDWTVNLIETGANTETGGRIKRLSPWIKNETFMMTYGDGISNINIQELVKFHKKHGKLATITTVRAPARFGTLDLDGNDVQKFVEKPMQGEAWINGGFLVLEPQVLDYIVGDDTHFEWDPLAKLAENKQLMAYRHDGFWQCIDTVRDLRAMEELWKNNRAPWKVWR